MEQSITNRLTDIVRANIDNQQFGVDELAREMSMSRSSLLRKLNSVTGKSTNQFIREVRLQMARDLILKEDITAA